MKPKIIKKKVDKKIMKIMVKKNKKILLKNLKIRFARIVLILILLLDKHAADANYQSKMQY